MQTYYMYTFILYVCIEMKLPFVIIFDIDGTLIGNLWYAIQEYYLLRYIYAYCKANDIHAKCPDTVIDIQHLMRKGLLRPYVREYLDVCTKKYQNVEIFIYTKSSYSWTNDVIVKEIEKALGYKFNKPYFTRENTLPNNEKALSAVYRDIMMALQTKYPLLRNEKHRMEVFDERLIFIDDIPNNLYDFQNKQILCPEYTYQFFYDIPDKLVKKYKIPKSVMNDPRLLAEMQKNNIPVYNKHGSVYQRDAKFVRLQKKYFSMHAELSNKKDTFFKDLTKIVKSLKEDNCNSKTISMINSKLTSKS